MNKYRSSNGIIKFLMTLEFLAAFIPVILLWVFALFMGPLAIGFSPGNGFAIFYCLAMILGVFGFVGAYQLCKVGIKRKPIEISQAAFCVYILAGHLSLLFGYFAMQSIKWVPAMSFFVLPVVVSIHFVIDSRKRIWVE